MRRFATVGVVLLLGLVFFARPAEGQQADPDRGRGFQLEQNYPNPFNPVTRIPFVLSESLFAGGKPVEVTVRIYNSLLQLVAIPTALNHPAGNGVRVDNLLYTTPGRYEAFWDGLDRNGRKVASGVYIVQLVINGERATKKITVAN